MGYSLVGKTSFITGASSGIGKACAIAFAKAGARLILTARRYSELEALSNSLMKEFGTETHIGRLDVRNFKEVTAFVSHLPPEWEEVDILVNNAGLSRGLDKLHEGKIDDWEEMIDTNVKGLLYVSRAVIPAMVKRNKGMIINIGSIAGKEVYVGGNVYCATKHAVDAVTRGLRHDLTETDIRVCQIAPGLVETEFSKVRFHGDQQRAANVYKGYVPLSGEDVADAVLYCATRPPHVEIADLLILPTAQSSVGLVYKKS